MAALQRTAIVVLTLALLAPACLAEAQVVETRTYVLQKATQTAAASSLLGQLEEEFVRGEIDDARDTVRQILSCKSARVPLGCDTASDSVFVVWAGRNPGGATELHRLRLNPAGDRRYTLDLYGVGTAGSATRVLEVFLATDEKSALSSSYRSTRTENPLLAQFPVFALQIIAPMFGIIGATVTIERSTLWATVSQVKLPFARATIVVASRAVLSVESIVIEKQVTNLGAQVAFDSATHSPWARPYVDRLPDVVMAGLKKCKLDEPWAACLKIVDAALLAAHEACQRDRVPGKTPAGDDIKAMDAVEGKFRAFVNGLPGTLKAIVTAEVNLNNTPLTHFSLGSATGVVMKAWPTSKARVTLDSDGVLAADPLGRALTMAVVNWSWKGYDAAAFRPTPGERAQLFAGAIILPDIGGAGGLSLQVARGFAFNIGAGLIFSKGLNGTDQVGQKPTDPLRSFAVAVTPVVFFGASVNFAAK